MLLNFIFILLFTKTATQTPAAHEFDFNKAKGVAVDPLDQIYLVDSLDHLLKVDTAGKVLYTFEDKSFPVEHIDAKNGLKVLVYNSQLNVVKFLDRTLSPINESISVDGLNIPISHAVGMSRDNLFWVFDENNQSLEKFDWSSKSIASTGNLTNVIGKTIQPHQLIEDASNVYLLDSIHGLYQFDYLGTFLFHFKNVKAEKIQVMGKKIVFLKDKELYIYDSDLLEEKKLSLSGNDKVLDFALTKQFLVVVTEQKVKLYRNAFSLGGTHN